VDEGKLREGRLPMGVEFLPSLHLHSHGWTLEGGKDRSVKSARQVVVAR
jgi:hypothetical protein